MATGFNTPQLKDGKTNEGKVKRYVHQPLTFDHRGYRCKIKPNGQVEVISPPERKSQDSDEIEFDQITVPASLIFKLAQSLKLTREEKWLTLSEAKDESQSAPASE